MPSLRERPQDIPLIVADLFRESALAGRRFSAEAVKCLAGYRWPGNVRELQNEVLRALALGEGNVLDAGLFSPRLRQSAPSRMPAGEAEGATLKDRLEAVEAQVIRDALQRHRGNKTRVAEELGLTRVGLRMKLCAEPIPHPLGLAESDT
jgi:two-component system response regulator HupR/HoxA